MRARTGQGRDRLPSCPHPVWSSIQGLLIVGTSIAAAFVATYRMERACAMQLAFQQSGAEFHPIADEVVKHRL